MLTSQQRHVTYLKAANSKSVKSSPQEKKGNIFFNCVVMEVNWTYCGVQFAIQM